jgi:hypothetical protein
MHLKIAGKYEDSTRRAAVWELPGSLRSGQKQITGAGSASQAMISRNASRADEGEPQSFAFAW